MNSSGTITGELRDWRKQVCSPDGTCIFWGHIYGDVLNRFPDGHFIHTSGVIEISNDTVITRNGRTYKLVGPPSGEEVNPWSYLQEKVKTSE